ncbi:MAG: hypothetical protein CM15mP49_26140 [Actinomycetota bacterium]|nr:MAG: hypothetical protein CM15mP49_26140 [Actinomycetota bacterium]
MTTDIIPAKGKNLFKRKYDPTNQLEGAERIASKWGLRKTGSFWCAISKPAPYME